MNRFKCLCMAACLSCLGGVILLSSSYAAEIEDTLIEVPVYIKTSDMLERTAFEEVFTKEDINDFKTLWDTEVIYDADTVEIVRKRQMIPASNHEITLYADDKPVTLSKTGTIKVPKDTKTVSRVLSSDLDTINADDYKTEVSETFYFADLLQADKNYEVVFEASCGELIARMDEQEEKCANKLSVEEREAHKGYGDKYLPGDWVHCNRFNGPKSDWVHYNWRGGNPIEVAKALRNFSGSDCDMALLAGSGCMSIGSCQCNTSKRAAYCSSFTKYEDGTNCAYHFHRHMDAPAAIR